MTEDTPGIVFTSHHTLICKKMHQTLGFTLFNLESRAVLAECGQEQAEDCPRFLITFQSDEGAIRMRRNRRIQSLSVRSGG